MPPATQLIHDFGNCSNARLLVFVFACKQVIDDKLFRAGTISAEFFPWSLNWCDGDNDDDAHTLLTKKEKENTFYIIWIFFSSENKKFFVFIS